MSLELEHVAVSYGANPILRDVTARLEPGQIVGLIGPNGTGKSTLIKSIATVQRFSGAIRWQGAFAEIVSPESLRAVYEIEAEIVTTPSRYTAVIPVCPCHRD